MYHLPDGADKEVCKSILRHMTQQCPNWHKLELGYIEGRSTVLPLWSTDTRENTGEGRIDDRISIATTARTSEIDLYDHGAILVRPRRGDRGCGSRGRKETSQREEGM